ncbi:MAG: hypothetical protein K1X89_05870 [Myxococcaceae bacterium]|nr:hypothetical protein [Myxococcaceae bacterium]
MSLLPHDATFEELVQDCFTAFRGRGVMLSALDAELVHAWALQAVPYEVVARGIKKAAARLQYDARPDEGLRSLSACRRDVEQEIAKYLRTSIGQHQPAPAKPRATEPLEATRARKLKAVLLDLAAAHPRLTGLQAFVERLAPAPDLAAADRQEARAVAAVLRALPFAERFALLREASRLVQNAQPITAQARLDSLRFFRAWQLRRHLDVPSFW